MFWGLSWVGVVVGAALALAAPAQALQAGEVLTLKGTCFVEATGQQRPLKVGDALQVGDVVTVASGAKLKLRMSDGSVISAAAGTRVAIEAYNAGGAGRPRDARLELVTGLLRAVVATVDQPSRFEVGTATGVAAVRSTDWFIMADPATTEVGVLDGSVALAGAGPSVTIPAGWGARIGRDPEAPHAWSKAQFDDVITRTNAD